LHIVETDMFDYAMFHNLKENCKVIFGLPCTSL